MITKLNIELDLLNIRSRLYLILIVICGSIAIYPNNILNEFKWIFVFLIGYYILLVVFAAYSSFRTVGYLAYVREEEKLKENRLKKLEKAVEELGGHVERIMTTDKFRN